MGADNSREKKLAGELQAQQAENQRLQEERDRQRLQERKEQEKKTAELRAQKEEHQRQREAHERQLLQVQSEQEKERLRMEMESRENQFKQQMDFMSKEMSMKAEMWKANQQMHEKQLEALAQQAREQDRRFAESQEQHKRDMEAFQNQNAEMMKQFQGTIDMLKEELAKAEEEPFDPDDPDKLQKIQDANFQKFCEAAGSFLKDVPKKSNISIAVLGMSGVGKSTLINAFANREVAETDVVECTQVISKAYSCQEWDFYDVPGQTDERADFYNVQNLHELKSLHLIFCVYNERIQNCTKLGKLMRSIELPFFFVRQKCTFLGNAETAEKAMAKEKDVTDKLGLDFPVFYLGALTEEDKAAGKYRMEGVEDLIAATQKLFPHWVFLSGAPAVFAKCVVTCR